MDEPLVVPGHPVDNPPTDDFWPHLSPGPTPAFTPDDGPVTGPVRIINAQWFSQSATPTRFGDLPPITDALIALTDTRLVILGQPGVNTPPDRRLISQFRHVWCSAVTWDFASRNGPGIVGLQGMSGPDGQIVQRGLQLTMPPAFDSRAFVQDLLQRIARNYLRLDLADSTGFVDSHTTEKQYLENLASSPINPSERQSAVPFPRFRWIRHGDDYRTGGADVRTQMVHAQLSSN